jgi:MOSC domain-containing protein YiiM
VTWSAAVTTIDSSSAGDADRFRSLADLRQMLEELPRGSGDTGRVTLLMRRCEGGRRETLHEVVMAPDIGVAGDAWCRAAQRNKDMQIAVMEKDVAELIANGQSLTLFGDCLILDLDLSSSNLPPGSRVRVGGAILEVTPMPHNGCRKFNARFGNDALRFVSMPELRSRNLRGIYMRVEKGGEVEVGDSVDVIFRPVGR